LILCRCSYSAILRGAWPCQPRIPAGRRTPMPHSPAAPFSTWCYLLLAHHHPSALPCHCLTTSRCLHRQLFPAFADNKSLSRPYCMMIHLPQQTNLVNSYRTDAL
jgi:hypothetical protein